MSVMMLTRIIAIKDFKYGKQRIKRGDEFEPLGGKFDKQILDPTNKFVIYETAPETAPTEYPCPDCERTFSKPQGLAGHKRHCKGRKT